MSESSGTRDRDLVIHLILTAILIAASAAALLIMVPALFNQHSTPGDLAALGAVVLVPAGDYLAARYIWRSWTAVSGGDER
jgi:hypothetical protein